MKVGLAGAVAVLLLAAAAGAAVDVTSDGVLLVEGRRFFPLEIYRAGTDEAMAEVASAGFNTVVAGSREAVERAWSHGLFAVVSVGYHDDATVDLDRIRSRVLDVMDHPAVLGYVLVDEPDLRDNVATPTGLDRVAAFVRSVDPSHPVMVTCSGINGAWRLPAYQSAVDVVRADPYPVFYARPLTWACEVLDLLRWSGSGRSASWLILQAWAGPDAPVPTAGQDRTLTYLAVVHGAKGISHYAYQFSDRGKTEKVADSFPELWRGMCEVAGELSAVQDDLAAPPPDVAVHVAASSAPVEAAVFGSAPDLLIVAVNPSDLPTTARLTLTSDIEPVVRLPFEERTLPTDGMSFEDAFAPGGVHLYRVRLAEEPPGAVCLLPPSLRGRPVEYPAAALFGGEAATVSVQVGRRPVRATHVRGGVRDVPVRFSRDAWRGREPILWRWTSTAHRGRVRVEPSPGGGCTAEADGVAVKIRSARAVTAGGRARVVVEVSGDLPEAFSLRLRHNAGGGEAVLRPSGRAFRRRFTAEVPVPADSQPDHLWLLADLTWEVDGQARRLLAPLEVPVHRRFEARFVPDGLWVDPDGVARGVVWLSREGSVRLMPDPGWTVRPEDLSGAGELAFTLVPGQRDIPARGRLFGVCRSGASVLALGADCVLPVWAPLAVERVVPDGDLSEWNLSYPVGPSRASPDLRARAADDPSATLYMMWDERRLYIAARVRDADHVDGWSAVDVWRNDGLQISIDAGPRPLSIKGPFSDGHFAFGVALSAGEPVKGGWFAPAGVDLSRAVESIGFGAKRDGDAVTYEVAVPWTCVGLSRAPETGDLFVGVLLNDWDRSSSGVLRRWLEFGGGIVYGCQPTQYMPVALLSRKGTIPRSRGGPGRLR